MSLQLDLFAEPEPVLNIPAGEASELQPSGEAPTTADALPVLAAQLLDALRIHSVPDHERCKVGGLAELERQANGILRGVESRRPLLTDERWQAALHALPYYYVRGFNNYGI
jgi:hypothetical protein